MKRTYLCLLGAILLLSGCAGGTQATEQTEEPEQTEQVIPTEEPEAAPEEEPAASAKPVFRDLGDEKPLPPEKEKRRPSDKDKLGRRKSE